MSFSPRKTLAAASVLLALSAAPAMAQDAKVEALYQQWLQGTLFPKAAARGVSKTTFDKAFAGVKINWKLPDLVPPGTKAQTPK